MPLGLVAHHGLPRCGHGRGSSKAGSLSVRGCHYLSLLSGDNEVGRRPRGLTWDTLRLNLPVLAR